MGDLIILSAWVSTARTKGPTALRSAASPLAADPAVAPLASVPTLSIAVAARLLGKSQAHARALQRAGVVPDVPILSYQDMSLLRAADALVDGGVSIRSVAAAVRAARRWVGRPLSAIRLSARAGRVLVTVDGATWDALTGQQALDFASTSAVAVVQPLRPHADRGVAERAYAIYREAARVDEIPGCLGEAQRLYEQALDLDPKLADAWTNLGNLLHGRGDVAGAEEHYRRASALNPRQPESHYNLGCICMESGRKAEAVAWFRRAIEANPRFAVAWYNLAAVSEEGGDEAGAESAWRRYVELEPSGIWANAARKRLGALGGANR